MNEKKHILSQETRELLRTPFPPEAIKKHPTKTFLSTLKAMYVTERLNNVFGIGGWRLVHNIHQETEDYVSVRGHIEINTDEYSLITMAQYGGHKKTGKNTEPADGYKSAITDCQSKCASYLEIGIHVFLGLQTHNKQPPVDSQAEAIKNKGTADNLIAELEKTTSLPHKDNWKKKHTDEINDLDEKNKARVIAAGTVHTKKLTDEFKEKKNSEGKELEDQAKDIFT